MVADFVVYTLVLLLVIGGFLQFLHIFFEVV